MILGTQSFLPSINITGRSEIPSLQKCRPSQRVKPSHQPAMSTSAACRLHLALCLLLLLFFFAAVDATDHIVGANRGWNPSINYTLWANNHTFYVGDLISFRYQKMQYNVYEVNQTGYDNCTTDGAVGNWSSGKDFILLEKAKRYYFICPSGCYNGMKVSVLVHPLHHPPSAAAAEHSSEHSAARPGGHPSVLEVVVAVFSSIWFGSGWI